MPPHLAGRDDEAREFERLLAQDPILENLVLTGLRGVGKTVLMETLKPIAAREGWYWVGTDLSESASISEDALARRLLTDLSVVTSGFTVPAGFEQKFGFTSDPSRPATMTLGHAMLSGVFDAQPGLVTDKLKAVLEVVRAAMAGSGSKLVFAYDEAQNLSDHRAKDEYPLSLLLDSFASVQRQGAPFLLVLTGLPTLFPKLVEARTFAERMFRVVTLARLSRPESREAILKPLEDNPSEGEFTNDSVEMICDMSAGYPYFIQFVCREIYDVFIRQGGGTQDAFVPMEAIQGKLDSDFFAGRWARATDRQRQLLWLAATLDRPDEEFTIQEIGAKSRDALPKAFSSSHINQILSSLANQGLVYKNRFGKYSFAVPLFGAFILRTYTPPE